jgi:transposase
MAASGYLPVQDDFARRAAAQPLSGSRVHTVKLPWAEPNRPVNDLDRGRVFFVAENRTEESLNRFWEQWLEGHREAVTAVAMDMWDPYVQSTPKLKEADRKIVFDKFHIAKHLSEAADEVRRREHKQLKASGDDRLAGTRYDWLRHPARMEPEDRRTPP